MGLVAGLNSYEEHREDFNRGGCMASSEFGRNSSAAKKLTFASRLPTTLKRPNTSLYD